jgi:hypothetical protein
MFGDVLNVTLKSINATTNSNNNSLTIDLKCPQNVHLNTDAPNRYTASSNSSHVQIIQGNQETPIGNNSKINVAFDYSGNESATITVNANLYVCSDSGLCSVKNALFTVNVNPGDEGVKSFNDSYTVSI